MSSISVPLLCQYSWVGRLTRGLLGAPALAGALFVNAISANAQPPADVPLAHETNLSKNGMRDFALGTSPRVASQTPQVRMIYMVPSDRQAQAAYPAAMERAIRSLQIFYRNQMGNGTTFALHSPVVEVVSAPQPASYYSIDIWNRTLADGFKLMNAGFNDPNNRWVFMIDADPDCKSGGAYGGTSGVALLPKNDLRGDAGAEGVPVCPGDQVSPSDWLCRWIGGLGHELGHAFGLPHPPACEQNIAGQVCPPNALMWTGLYNYPDAVLLPENRTLLASTPFFQPVALTSELPSCRSAPLTNGPVLSLSPSSISFTASPTAPAFQTVNVTSSSTAFLVAPSAFGWLSVTPARTSTPMTLQVAANPVGLPTGTYQGYIELVTTGAANGSQRVNASLVVSGVPPPSTIDGTISTVAGGGRADFDGDGGSATSASLNSPYQVAIDVGGNLYIADSGNNAIRKVTPTGIISTVAGIGQPDFRGDGGPAANASLNAPWGVAVDLNGNLYISDTGNHRIRKVNTQGLVTTVAGTGVAGFSGDGQLGTGAQINTPLGITTDKDGNVYIADSGNGRIRKLSPTGIISTVAGNGSSGSRGDGGPAIAASLGRTFSVALDPFGNLYIPEFDHNDIRKVTPAGVIQTVSFMGVDPAGSDYGRISTLLLNPVSVALDSSGAIYVTEWGGARIRKIIAGYITTIAGSGRQGDSGDGAYATASLLGQPRYLTLDATGNAFFSDEHNQRIRKVSPPPALQLSSAGLVNAASFASASSVTADEFVSWFGSEVVSQVAQASSSTLPLTLGGVGLAITDSTGKTSAVPLQLVAASQINLVVPTSTAQGPAGLTVVVSGGRTATVPVQLAPTAAGLFSANSSGKGVAAAIAVHIRADGTQDTELVFSCDSTGCGAHPISFGGQGDKLSLVLFGTGIRGRNSLQDVSIMIGGQTCQLLYAGAQGQYPGLDQVNVVLPQQLAGAGTVDIVLSVAGKVANTVSMSIQ